MNHPFGDLLGQFLHRKRGLSQFKLAEGIDQPPSVVSEMCQGKRLTGSQARRRVVAIIMWLHQQGALITKEEAQVFLEAAGMAPLQERDATEAGLLQQLNLSSRQNILQNKENTPAEQPGPRWDWERSTAAPRQKLPVQLTPLIGRESDIDEVIKILNQPDCRLLTLTGQGGIGKTRLAIQVAAQVAANSSPDFHDGIFFTALQPATGPAFLAQTIMDAIGIPINSTDAPQKALIHFLREQKMLLLLDNFEEILNSSAENTDTAFAFLLDMIQQAPGIKVLITSRSVLNLSGEWIYLVTGLSYPPFSIHESTTAGQIIEDPGNFAAIRLFIDRARHVQPNFSPAEEFAGILQICQLVEGLPLALEIAATWTKMMSCAAIATEITRSLAFLETRYKDVPVRHRNVLSVINQSWQNLTSEERVVFARLSVFKGGFQRQAAEQVAGATLSILSALVDQSLLRWEPGDRYQIHELIRQFAQEHLQADPTATQYTCTLHCKYFSDFLNERSADITGPHQQDVLRRITADLQNIRAAWGKAVEDINLEALKKSAYTYYQFCDFTSHYLEGAETFEFAINKLLASNAAGPQTAEVLALLYPLLGYHYIRLGKFESSQKAFQTSQEILLTYQLNISPGFGTDPITGYSLLALVKGDYSRAIQYAESGRDASIMRNDPLNLQIACYVLANAALSLGENEQALVHIKQGLLSTEVTGNQWMKAQLLSIQGQIARAQNQFSLAQQKFRESYLIKQELNDPEGEANAINQMAMLAFLQGNATEAHQLYRKSLEIFQHIHDPGGLGSTYAGLGDSAQANDDLVSACHYYSQGLQIALKIEWLPLMILLLTGISDLLLHFGRAKQSYRLLQQVLAHPAIAEDARIRALHSLEHVFPQLQSPSGIDAYSIQAPEIADEDLLRISQTMLVDLNDLTIQYAHTESRLKHEMESTIPVLQDQLTAREIQVLRLIAQGKTNQQIAEAFVLSVGTVKWYSQQIYQKLGVGNRTHAVARAREIHLVD